MVLYHDLLRKQYAPRGVYAGATHFHDVWARDALFASFGSLGVGDVVHARDTVQLFLEGLRHDGLVPMRIGAKDQVLSYLGIRLRHGHIYAQDKGNNPAVDSNLLLLILAEHVERAGGKRFSRRELRRVAHWVVHSLHEDGLLHQGSYADWEDSIKTRGVRLYTSVCLVRALRACAYLFRDRSFTKQALVAERAVQSWWTGTHFADGPGESRCMTAGNLLAIMWDIASKRQARTILAYTANRKTVCPSAGAFVPTRRSVYAPFFLVNLADYHTSMEWSWLAALEILCYEHLGDHVEAQNRREAFDALVMRHGSVYEIYERDEPVKRFIYRSEKDFGWTIGLRCATKL